MKSLFQKVKELIGIEEAPRTKKSIQQKSQAETKRQQLRRVRVKGCHFCRRTDADFSRFYDDNRQPIHVCPLCLEYADRRAYKKR